MGAGYFDFLNFKNFYETIRSIFAFENSIIAGISCIFVKAFLKLGEHCNRFA